VTDRSLAAASGRGRQPSFWRALGVHRRIIGALFLREIQTRWGRRNLGFAWLFAEPLIFALPIITMWHLIRPPTDHGVPMILFIWTGYLGILMFRHVSQHALNVVSNNSGLLYHSLITPLDIFLGICVLEALGNLAATAFSYLILYMLDAIPLPSDPTLVLIGFAYMTWWSLAAALVIGALSERFEIIPHLWAPIAYMYLPVSGFMYMAFWLPNTLRPIALTIIPPLHAYEMIRGGFMGNAVPVFYDTRYLTFLLAGLTMFGLLQMRMVREHLKIDA
jgi:capsular polysaccharide transport system permease protein